MRWSKSNSFASHDAPARKIRERSAYDRLLRIREGTVLVWNCKRKKKAVSACHSLL